MIDFGLVKNRVIETGEIDAKHLLRPLLLYKGAQTEGGIRRMWNLIVTSMDANVPSVTEVVKLHDRHPDYRHVCGSHSKAMTAMGVSSALSRIITTDRIHDLVPGLREYTLHLLNSSGASFFRLDPIAEIARQAHREWRIGPAPERRSAAKKKPPAPVLPEVYPYISGPATDEHALLLTVDSIVPKGLPNSVRCDVCQDMIVAVLSGETTLDNLRGDLKKYMSQFWKMFPGKYGDISLDAIMPGTESLRLLDRIGYADQALAEVEF